MFCDKSINIHYLAPTSKLLKMNTFNEFELNRLKKFYADELANRLHKSKSSRSNGEIADESYCRGRHPATDCAYHDYGKTRGESRSAERLPRSSQNQQLYSQAHFATFGRNFWRPLEAQATGGCPVDLKRYERALNAKSSTIQGRNRSPQVKLEQSGRFGRAIHDFHAKSGLELSLTRGDLVELLEQVDDSWLHVEDCQSGLKGLVPVEYIDRSVGCAVAKRDVCASEQRQTRRTGDLPRDLETVASLLPMSKGEPITLLRRLSGHWYEASNTRQGLGLVWSNDLEIIKQPTATGTQSLGRRARSAVCARTRETNDELAEDFTDDEDEEDDLDNDYGCGTDSFKLRRARSSSTGAHNLDRPTLKVGRSQDHCCRDMNVQNSHDLAQGHGLANIDHDYPAKVCMLATPRRSSSSPYISSIANQRCSEGSHDGHRRSKTPINMELPRLCRAKYAYKPRQKDELELMPGDVLVIVHQCDDGWYIGTSYSTNQMGTFPGNFVESI